MKKTLKIFLISFTLSSFAIWVANELFFSVAPSKSDTVALPKKNIALFFQENEGLFPAVKTTSVKESRLAAIIPAAKEDAVDSSHVSLFGINKNTTHAISIASVEDAADIPLEYGAPQKQHKNKALKLAKQAAKEQKTVSQEAAAQKQPESPKGISVAAKTEAPVSKTENAKKESQPEVMKLALKAGVQQSFAETDFIPFENGDNTQNTGNVEIVNAAPQSQIAMAGDKISVDTLAIEQNDINEAPKKREWQPMTAVDDSPWVVAQANKYAKNNKAVEDFAAKEGETEIENLLSPKKMEEEGQEVKTAEMVKNILIPIPEDILNDKNLTPQLVSSKKSASDVTFDQDEEDVEAESENGSNLFKSITSIFSSSSNSEEEDSAEETKEPKKKKKKGLFAAFSNDKTVTKILPAEMKLAFQPGRAEISGQTLRWIQAFANKAVEDPNVVLEIRIDKNSSYALQQRRLDLLHTILSSRGMDSEKVNTVFTSREPNSFIIRTLRLSDNTRSKPVKNYQRKNANYQTW